MIPTNRPEIRNEDWRLNAFSNWCVLNAHGRVQVHWKSILNEINKKRDREREEKKIKRKNGNWIAFVEKLHHLLDTSGTNKWISHWICHRLWIVSHFAKAYNQQDTNISFDHFQIYLMTYTKKWQQHRKANVHFHLSFSRSFSL